MTQSDFKYLALLLMLVDHIGLLLERDELRLIGRLSFPIFCWVLAKNWERRGEKEPKNLIIRLMCFGIISQIPYTLFTGRTELNILLSFLITILTFKEIHHSKHKIVIIIIGMVAAHFLNASYGWFAVICPLLMMNFKGHGSRGWWFCWTTINIVYTVTSGYFMQIFAITTPLILMQYNAKYDARLDGKPGKIEKYFFYWFYPIHLIILAMLKGSL